MRLLQIFVGIMCIMCIVVLMSIANADDSLPTVVEPTPSSDQSVSTIQWNYEAFYSQGIEPGLAEIE